MRAKDIYLHAAEFVFADDGSVPFAIKKAKGLSVYAPDDKHVAGMRALFKSDTDFGWAWSGPDISSDERHELRVLALCFMAAMS